MKKTGFIGAGVMGSAIIKGILRKGYMQPRDILVYDTDNSKTSTLAEISGVVVTESTKQLCINSDCIFICVKPAAVKALIKNISEYITKDKCIVSIAAGVTTQTIAALLNEKCDIIRTMPNTPLLVGEGMTVISTELATNPDSITHVKGIFESSGKVAEMPENLMSEVISLTGSSPAYVYMLIEAMADGAAALGISRDEAIPLAAQTVIGAAKMVMETGEDPVKLRNDVCSPGGTTIEAVKVLKQRAFSDSVAMAMKACTDKAYILGKEAEKQ